MGIRRTRLLQAGSALGAMLTSLASSLWLLIQVPMSTREISVRCGMQMSGAWKMLNLISRVVPLYRDGGKWRILRIS